MGKRQLFPADRPLPCTNRILIGQPPLTSPPALLPIPQGEGAQTCRWKCCQGGWSLFREHRDAYCVQPCHWEFLRAEGRGISTSGNVLCCQTSDSLSPETRQDSVLTLLTQSRVVAVVCFIQDPNVQGGLGAMVFSSSSQPTPISLILH